MEEFKEAPAGIGLNLRDKLLIGRRMFRLLTVDVLGLAGDALTPVGISKDGVYETDIIDRAEIRTQAISVNLNRFKIEKEIGSDDYRSNVESAFLEEFATD